MNLKLMLLTVTTFFKHPVQECAKVVTGKNFEPAGFISVSFGGVHHAGCCQEWRKEEKKPQFKRFVWLVRFTSKETKTNKQTNKETTNKQTYKQIRGVCRVPPSPSAISLARSVKPSLDTQAKASLPFW